MKWNEALTLILILQLFDRVNLYVSKTSVICVFLFLLVFLMLLKKQIKGKEWLIFIISTCVRLCAHLSFCVFVINITDSDLDEICYVA